MKIDREKFVKGLATLVALCVVVGGLTQIRKHNSLSLADYAVEHPEANLPETTTESSDTPETAGNHSSVDQGTSDIDDKESANDSSATSTVENLQNEVENTPLSLLTGATLNADTMKEQRITYIKDFYYEPLSDNLRRYITGVSYPAAQFKNSSFSDNADDEMTDLGESANVSTDSQANISGSEPAISYDDLRYVHILHYNFDGNLAEGELICNESIAQDLVEIFYELYRNEYQLEKVLLIDEYDGDDTASMEDNNTSCFNYRVVEGTTSLSKHALGVAIDINPFYNPYVTYEKDGSEKILPAASIDYADRSANFPYKINENDLCYKLFTEHGFTWGGNWNSCKDYQHFQKISNK